MAKNRPVILDRRGDRVRSTTPEAQRALANVALGGNPARYSANMARRASNAAGGHDSRQHRARTRRGQRNFEISLQG